MRALAEDVFQAEAVHGEAGLGGDGGADGVVAQGENLGAHPTRGLGEIGAELGDERGAFLAGGDARVLVGLEVGVDVDLRVAEVEGALFFERGEEGFGPFGEAALEGFEVFQLGGDGETCLVPALGG